MFPTFVATTTADRLGESAVSATAATRYSRRIQSIRSCSDPRPHCAPQAEIAKSKVSVLGLVSTTLLKSIKRSQNKRKKVVFTGWYQIVITLVRRKVVPFSLAIGQIFIGNYHKLPILRTSTLTSDKPCGFAEFHPRG
jgi:hypothetical protein